MALSTDSQPPTDQPGSSEAPGRPGALPTGSGSPVASHTAGFGDVTAWQRLSEADSLPSFALAWLDLQCRLIDSVRSAVVVFGPDQAGVFLPLAQWPVVDAGDAVNSVNSVNSVNAGNAANTGAAPSPALAAVAELSLAERRGVVRHQAGGEDADAASTDAIAYPLLVGGELRGAVAIELVAQADHALAGSMRLLQWGCGWWQQRLLEFAGEEGGVGADALRTVLELLGTTLQEHKFIAAATALVTDLATRLDCDRAAFGSRDGRHIKVRAISHSANFNPRSNLVRALGNAMDEALDQQETLVLPAMGEQSPLVTRAQQQLLDKHGGKAVCSVPLSDEGRLVGALLLMREGGPGFSADEQRLCEYAGTLVGPVLEAKRREQRWIGFKLWDSGSGLWSALVGAGHLGLKTAALASLALLLFLLMVSGEYRVTASASLEGSVQRAITAPLDGFVASAAVRAGDQVVEGQQMASLEDKELLLKKIEWQGQREKHRREYSQALARGERARVRILAAQVDQAEAHIALLAEQLARTHISAPFDGVVVSGDLSQSLGAPVSRGELLFEVAPLNSYRVMLQVDERDIRQLAVGQRGQLALAGLPGEPLPLEVSKITPVANAGEGRNLFQVEARLQRSSTALRPGMRGVAKVDIEQRKLWWIWTHKLGYWLRLRWWSWWP